MTKFNIDYDHLSQKIDGKKAFRLADVQHRVEKVAWDVVRFTDSDNIDNLWRIEHMGNDDVIVAMYEDDAEVKTASASSNWQVSADKSANYITIFYKGDPIKKVASTSFNMANGNASVFCHHLSQKLAGDKALVTSMLKDLPEAERTALVSKYPELTR